MFYFLLCFVLLSCAYPYILELAHWANSGTHFARVAVSIVRLRVPLDDTTSVMYYVFRLFIWSFSVMASLSAYLPDRSSFAGVETVSEGLVR